MTAKLGDDAPGQRREREGIVLPSRVSARPRRDCCASVTYGQLTAAVGKHPKGIESIESIEN